MIIEILIKLFQKFFSCYRFITSFIMNICNIKHNYGYQVGLKNFCSS